MLYTPHFLTGAAIVKLIPNPVVGLPLAFLSHIILDLTPHNDFDIKPGVTLKDFFKMEKKRRNFILTALAVDYLLTFSALCWLFITNNNYWLVLGGIVGISPDAFEQLLMLFGKKLPGWQDKFQFRVSAKYGFISYPIVSLLALYFLLK